MKKNILRVFLVICINLLVSPLLHAGTSATNIVYHITHDMNSFSTLFPLKESSMHEKEAVQFIKNRLNALKVSYSEYTMDKTENLYSNSVILDAVFHGKTKDEIFLIIPLDTTGKTTKKTAAYNISTALMLAESLQSKELRNTVHIVFMGAESGTSDAYPLGTEVYLNSYYPAHNSAFFYCNIVGIPAGINVSTSGTGSISPLWLLKKSIGALKKTKLPFTFRQGQNLIYRLKLNDKPSLIDKYFRNGYSAILFQNTKNTAGVSAHLLLPYYTFLYTIATEKGWVIPSDKNNDKHYLFFKTGNTSIFVNEQQYVFFLIGLFSLMMIYPFLKTKRFKRYTKLLVRHLWTIPLLFILTFIFLTGSTYALKAILFFRSFPTLWKEVPLVWMLFKLIFSSFLFLLSLRLFKFLTKAHRGSFYSAAAIFFTILDVLFLSAMDITFALYLFPVLFMVFLFTTVRNRWFKLSFLLLSTVMLVAGMINMFLGDSMRVIHIFLLSPIYGDLIISANLLPILLMIYRLRFLFHYKNTKTANKMIFIFDASIGLISVLLSLFLFLFNPFSPSNNQPLTIVENINMDSLTRKVTLKSPAPLGNLTISDNFSYISFTSKKRKITFQSQIPVNLPFISLTKTHFLNRAKYSLTYNGNISADYIEIRIISDKRIILFDSNYSYKENNDLTEISFITGFSPPLNFFLTFTVPENFNGEILVTGKYTAPKNTITVKNHLFSIKREQFIKKILLITNSD